MNRLSDLLDEAGDISMKDIGRFITWTTHNQAIEFREKQQRRDKKAVFIDSGTIERCLVTSCRNVPYDDEFYCTECHEKVMKHGMWVVPRINWYKYCQVCYGRLPDDRMAISAYHECCQKSLAE